MEETYNKMEEKWRVKQIIVIRKDVRTAKGEKVRRGKEIAQGAHASTAWFTTLLRQSPCEGKLGEHSYSNITVKISPAEFDWAMGNFAKITCQVPDEAALLAIYRKALDAGLKAFLIEDAGLTEFAGVKTATAVGIGPDYAYKIDPVCHELQLY